MSQLIDVGQDQMDLTPFIGRNILPQKGDISDPFGGKVPDDAKGYHQYRRHYEGVMQDVMRGQDGQQQGFMMITANCETVTHTGEMQRMSGKFPEHEGCGVVHACNHVIHQDPINPDGIEFIPHRRGSHGGYYLCRICSKSLQRNRLNFEEIKMKCAKCVLGTMQRIMLSHPDRVVNLNEVG